MQARRVHDSAIVIVVVVHPRLPDGKKAGLQDNTNILLYHSGPGNTAGQGGQKSNVRPGRSRTRTVGAGDPEGLQEALREGWAPWCTH